MCSAHQIIHDLNFQRRGRDLLYDTLCIKDDYRNEWIRNIKNPYNFLKHADRDPAGTMELDTDLTEYFIMFSLLGLELLGEQHGETEDAFIIFFAIHRSALLTDKGKKTYLAHLSSEGPQRLLEVKKLEFFGVYTDLRHAFDRKKSARLIPGPPFPGGN